MSHFIAAYFYGLISIHPRLGNTGIELVTFYAISYSVYRE